MRKGSEKYRNMMNELQNTGNLVNIIYINRNTYNLVINGTIVKVYKKRASANNKIKLMYNKLKKQN